MLKFMNTAEIKKSSLAPNFRVELLDNHSAVVEGAEGVLIYTENCIQLRAKKLIVTFTGTNLRLKTLDVISSVIEGDIEKLEYS